MGGAARERYRRVVKNICGGIRARGLEGCGVIPVHTLDENWEETPARSRFFFDSNDASVVPVERYKRKELEPIATYFETRGFFNA
jgi:hypothetical protein